MLKYNLTEAKHFWQITGYSNVIYQFCRKSVSVGGRGVEGENEKPRYLLINAEVVIDIMKHDYKI